MVMNMKYFIELYHNLAPITRYLFHFLIVLSLSVIFISFICFIFADKTQVYYDMKLLSSDMIIILRSSFSMISAGIIFTELLEKKEC